MFLRRRNWPARRSSDFIAVFSLAVILFGLVAAPFCRCNCGDHDTAAAAEAPACHAHAEHGKAESPSDHSCPHAGCAGLTAVIPQLPAQGSIASSAPSVVDVFLPSALDVIPTRLVLMRPGIERDVGPPIPAPLFSILRP
jgi:hypothetical protein